MQPQSISEMDSREAAVIRIAELEHKLAAAQSDLEHARNTNKLEREENDKLLAELAELKARVK